MFVVIMVVIMVVVIMVVIIMVVIIMVVVMYLITSQQLYTCVQHPPTLPHREYLALEMHVDVPWYDPERVYDDFGTSPHDCFCPPTQYTMLKKSFFPHCSLQCSFAFLWATTFCRTCPRWTSARGPLSFSCASTTKSCLAWGGSQRGRRCGWSVKCWSVECSRSVWNAVVCVAVVCVEWSGVCCSGVWNGVVC